MNKKDREQEEIDRQLCTICGLRWDEHDGRENHRFTNKPLRVYSDDQHRHS